MTQTPFFSIVTPSRNMLSFLPCCCNSVSDQNVDSEHIVIDAVSMDGTVEWLSNRQDIISIIEQDDGMYDAINKGVERARGEVISYLNCDEQYLPDTLKKVEVYFLSHPNTDILFGNALIVCPDGYLLAYRKGFVPRWQYVWGSFLYMYTCSMFIRRRVFDSGVRFNTNWRTVGDADFVVRVLRNGFRASHVNEYFSAFMMTGSNLSEGERAQVELRAFHASAPLWLRYSNFITHPLIRLEKFLHGAYQEKFPLQYSVYTVQNSDVRTEFAVAEASPLWKNWEWGKE